MRIHPRSVRDSRRTLLLRRAAGLASGLGALTILGWPSFAYAIACGDTLGPGGSEALDGPLGCDISPALTIVGPFTLNLHGFTISCVADNAGVGVGIDLTGVRAQVQDGTVADCGKGVVVEGNGRHELRRLIVTSPDRTSDQGIGFQVKSDRNRFIENVVKEYAGEGFRLGDDDVPANRNVLVRNEATDNANHGFRVRIGQQNVLLLNHAEHNATEGFRTQDGSNRFIANTAIGNGDEGFRLSDVAAQDNVVIGNTAEGNGLPEDNDQISCNFPPPEGEEPDINPGIVTSNEAANNKIIGNVTQGNCVGIGVETGAHSNEITKNVAFDNRLIDLADGNLDCDDNDWRINVFETSAAGPDFRENSPACIQ